MSNQFPGNGVPPQNFPPYGGPPMGQGFNFPGNQMSPPQAQGFPNIFPPQGQGNQMPFAPQGFPNLGFPPQAQGNPNFPPQQGQANANFPPQMPFVPGQGNLPMGNFAPPQPNFNMFPPQVGNNPYGGINPVPNMVPQSQQGFFQNNTMTFQIGGFMPLQTAPQQFRQEEKIYKNQKWIFGNANLKGKYEQKKNDFSNVLSNQSPQQAIQLLLTDNQSLTIKKSEIKEFCFIEHFEDSYDLRIINSITQSSQGVINALLFCHCGYIELEELNEMTQFLFACHILQINQPFDNLATYLQNPQNIEQNAHKLRNTDEIFDIYIFLDQRGELNNANHQIRGYLNFLISRNPYYYKTDLQEFNKKIKLLSYECFITEILINVGATLIQSSGQGDIIPLAVAETISSLVHMFFSENAQLYEDPQTTALNVFNGYYSKHLKGKLTELDEIKVLRLLPRESDEIINKLADQYEAMQKQKLREKALIRICIAQRAQNIAIESYKDQFKQSIKIITGEQLEGDIEQSINEEINRIAYQQ